MAPQATVPGTEEIRSRVRATLRRLFADALDGVGDGDELRASLGDRYDSLGATECISAVEGEFGVTVDFVADDVRHHFATVERITAFVRDKLEDTAALGTA